MNAAKRTSSVMAYSPDTNSSYAVIQQRDGDKPLALCADLDEQFNVQRCKNIFAIAQKMDSRNITKISIMDWDKNKEYRYDAVKNRLQIWQDGLPIYENWDGVICKDEVALSDCLL